MFCNIEKSVYVTVTVTVHTYFSKLSLFHQFSTDVSGRLIVILHEIVAATMWNNIL